MGSLPLTPAALAEHSRFVKRVRRRYETELSWLEPGPPLRQHQEALIDRLLQGGRDMASALRVARQLVMERLVVLDVEQGAPLAVVTTAMTELAEVTLERALAATQAELDTRFGAPLDERGERILMWVLGMGKLGGRELNVSSDIDLIYVYEEDGQTTGRPDGSGVITVHEYFSHVARGLSTLIGDTTEDGFVFRVDLALRPNGNSGPSVVSLAMLEEYFLVQGREWERFAWLKSRIVAPRVGVANERMLAVRDVVRPFVFRRYLDYGVFEGLRSLHQRIRDEANRRAAGRPQRANDVKLSRGGIREIEFTVQLLQVVRGGQFPEIRTRSTLLALQRLVAHGLMSEETAQRLAAAYEFLRRIEHRIQYLDDQQTHMLPTDDADLAWIAASMGAAPCNREACEFLDQLCAHREFVANEFDVLLHDRGKGGCKQCGSEPMLIDSDAFLSRLPAEIATRVRALTGQPRVQMLRDEARARLAALIARAAQLAAEPGLWPTDDATLAEKATLRFIDWLEPLLRRESYLALLAERPTVLRRLLRLLGLARWPMRYLMQHPGVIDELADERLLHGRFRRAAYLSDLEARHHALGRSGEAGEDELLDVLRRAHHAEVFRTLVRDVEGELEVEEVADDLSALADATLDCAIRWSWPLLKKRHREAPSLAVIAYGKLGGKELGYGSDLDVVFVYDDPDDNAAEIYTAFVRKLITWLTLRTAAGELFDIDTALRPNGNSGLLVTSLASFEAYQSGRGSNTAWTWEHQAITRSRWCAGEVGLAPRVEAVRRQVLAAPRDPQALRKEVSEMRDRMRQANAVPPNRFDLKHSPGGMIDAEFAVQWLVLAHGGSHPTLLDDVGNIALLGRAEDAGLLPAGVGRAAADAYRALRAAQHRARLDEASTRFDLAELGELAPHRQAVLALWRAVFG
ncbi:bifunctional [glutamate--ammonia ligase]-adenylyl-L-tyrosine phosphorylase/[glutamate--ammonia-ligase] adenylyltransferase [Aquabacterium sp.]|uniref:bifunctional [glutamate--ammonia ligase]-adenylyl-L-tyrosine phosphorylase/[glutamate--ammonia-ligase] adenylyltransferase n=1 Tax=Aquabacterium sp. TaxID=1872578 RepID=UPI0035B08859